MPPSLLVALVLLLALGKLVMVLSREAPDKWKEPRDML